MCPGIGIYTSFYEIAIPQRFDTLIEKELTINRIFDIRQASSYSNVSEHSVVHIELNGGTEFGESSSFEIGSTGILSLRRCYTCRYTDGGVGIIDGLSDTPLRQGILGK